MGRIRKIKIEDSILFEVIRARMFDLDRLSDCRDWIIVISFLGSRLYKEKYSDVWAITFDDKPVYDGQEIWYLNNRFTIWFDYHDYIGKKNNKDDISNYIAEYNSSRCYTKPGRFDSWVSWRFKPVRKNFSSFNEKLTGNSVDGEAEEAQPR